MESLCHVTRTNKSRTNKNRTNKNRTNKNTTNKNRLPWRSIKIDFALTFSYLKINYPYRLPNLLTYLIELDSQHETWNFPLRISSINETLKICSWNFPLRISSINETLKICSDLLKKSLIWNFILYKVIPLAVTKVILSVNNTSYSSKGSYFIRTIVTS